MTQYGIKVSKPNKQADSINPKDLVIDSNIEILKTIKSGSVNLTISGGTGSVDVIHDFGYYPTFLAYYGDGSGMLIEYPDAFSPDFGRESSSVDIGVKTDKTKLTFQGVGTDGTYAIYYEIFRQGGYR